MVALASAALLVWDATAEAAQSARLHVRFSPERMTGATAVSLGFEVAVPGGQAPSPLRAIDLRLPPSLGFATSGLGTASCSVALVQTRGADACPVNSRMGSGSARVRFQVGQQQFYESARIAVVAGPPQEGHVQMLVSATGEAPVAARILINGVLSAGRLQISIPLVPSLPEGGYVAVVAVETTLGGNLRYRERRGGRTISYRPRGIGLPRRCPRAGFVFGATFSFLDGSASTAKAIVPCRRLGG